MSQREGARVIVANSERPCRKLMPQAINGTEGSDVLKRYHKRAILSQAAIK